MRYATVADLAALPCDVEVAPARGHVEAALGRAEAAAAAGVGGGLTRRCAELAGQEAIVDRVRWIDCDAAYF